MPEHAESAPPVVVRVSRATVVRALALLTPDRHPELQHEAIECWRPLRSALDQAEERAREL